MEKTSNISIPNDQKEKDKKQMSEVYRDSNFRSKPDLSTLAIVKSPNNNYRFVIQFDNKIKILWDIFFALLLLFIIFYYPVFLAFCFEQTDSKEFWSTLNDLIDILFGIDIILTFFTNIVDIDGNIINNHKDIALNYITGWFIVDLVAIFPFQRIIMSPRASTNILLRLLRIPKLLRVLRMNKIGNMLDSIMKNYLKSQAKFKRFIGSINKRILSLINFVAILLLLIHLLACL